MKKMIFMYYIFIFFFLLCYNTVFASQFNASSQNIIHQIEYIDNIELSSNETAIIFVRMGGGSPKYNRAVGNIARVEPKSFKLDFIGTLKGGQGIAYIMPSGQHEFVITSNASYGNVLKGDFEAGRFYYVPIETVESKEPFILFSLFNGNNREQRIFADAIKKAKYIIPKNEHIQNFEIIKDDMVKKYKDSLETTDAVLYGAGIVKMPTNSGLRFWIGGERIPVNRIK